MACKGLGSARPHCVAVTLLLSCQRRQRHLSCVLLPRAGHCSLQLPFAICHSFCYFCLCHCTSLMQISICFENKYESSNSGRQQLLPNRSQMLHDKLNTTKPTADLFACVTLSEKFKTNNKSQRIASSSSSKEKQKHCHCQTTRNRKLNFS